MYQRRKKIIIGSVIFFVMLAGTILGALNIQQIRKVLTRASGEPANLVVDALNIQDTMQRPWANLAQGGEDKNWRLKPLADQVKTLNPRLIRIDHIYDFFEVPTRGGDGKLAYDWSKMDALVDDITSTGAKPLIALSYTPGPLAPNGDITGIPTNMQEMEEVYFNTIDHYSREKGIEGIYYEVWNEPDLFGGYKVYGPKNYLVLYEAAAKAAARVSANPQTKPFKFGGPAITALYENWVKGLLKFAQEKNYRLDFFSWHRYTADVDVYREDAAKATRWISEFPKYQDLELLITEWGHDSNNEPGYDSNFGAMHTLAVACELEGYIDRAFLFEIQDSKDPGGKEYWGRWGIFTADSVGAKAKPRFKALKFLEQLGNVRLQLSGKGTWVKALAAQKGDSIQVLVVNFDKFSANSETVPLTIKNAIEPSYRVTVQPFDGPPRTQEIASQNLTVSMTVPLGPNTASLVTLTPSNVPAPASQ